MFREELDTELAKNILGDEYRDDYTYTLYSDPDKFVVGITDKDNNFIGEVELKHDYELCDIEDDDLFKKEYAEPSHSTDIIRSWVITGVCIGSILLALLATYLILVGGGVL